MRKKMLKAIDGKSMADKTLKLSVDGFIFRVMSAEHFPLVMEIILNLLVDYYRKTKELKVEIYLRRRQFKRSKMFVEIFMAKLAHELEFGHTHGRGRTRQYA
jgi:hypothetical protein